MLQTEILEEAIRYIDFLHSSLVESIQENGFPSSLVNQPQPRTAVSDNGKERLLKVAPTI